MAESRFRFDPEQGSADIHGCVCLGIISIARDIHRVLINAEGNSARKYLSIVFDQLGYTFFINYPNVLRFALRFARDTISYVIEISIFSTVDR